jgi:hypothetical protein
MRTLSAAALLAVSAGLALAPAGPRAASDDGWGTIKGRVVFDGQPPKPEKVEVPADNKDREFCLSQGPIYKEEWVVNPDNKGVRWTIVWLAPEPGSTDPLPVNSKLKSFKPEVSIDQPCCRFVPHVVCVRKGQKLLVKNSAKKAHNVRWTGNPKVVGTGGNVVIPAGKSLTIEDLSSSPKVIVPIVSVNCDFHKWMSAKIAVFDHPYFAVTDKDGKFEIKDAPAGTYRLKVWHEAIGWRGGREGRNGMKVTIKPGGVTDLGKLGLAPKKE